MGEDCKFPMCKRIAQKNGYCISHHIYADAPVTKSAPQPIAKRSEDMKDKMKMLKKQYKAFLSKPGNHLCKVKADGCTKIAETVHHLKGRVGDLLFDEKLWKPCCWSCNGTVEAQDAEARSKGNKLSKFTPDESVSN